MRAAFLTGIRQMEIRETSQPEISDPHSVLLRIGVVGVCGSDVHYYTTGRIGSLVVKYPEWTGHECAGSIVGVGDQVKGLKVGQRVAVDPLIPCGHCDQCRQAGNTLAGIRASWPALGRGRGRWLNTW